MGTIPGRGRERVRKLKILPFTKCFGPLNMALGETAFLILPRSQFFLRVSVQAPKKNHFPLSKLGHGCYVCSLDGKNSDALSYWETEYSPTSHIISLYSSLANAHFIKLNWKFFSWRCLGWFRDLFSISCASLYKAKYKVIEEIMKKESFSFSWWVTETTAPWVITLRLKRWEWRIPRATCFIKSERSNQKGNGGRTDSTFF